MSLRTKLAALLLFSGLCALVYQVAWLRELRLIFGASTAASAAVLAVFMGGLGAGGLVLGRIVDRKKNPVGFYATLEILVALVSATTPFFVLFARKIYVLIGGSPALGPVGATFVRLLLAVVVLGAPTFLMGGTLPAVARAVETEADPRRKHLAVLYGVNTFGAVVGATLANFLLLEVFGDRLTLWLACLINLLVGVVARAVARSAASEVHATQTGASVVTQETEAQPDAVAVPGAEVALKIGTAVVRERVAPTAFVLLAAALVGFAFFLMELVWYRMLAPLLGGSSYTFGLILAVALFGIGCGGALYAFGKSDRVATLEGFAFTCALEALFLVVPLALGDRIALLALFTRPLGGFGFAGLVSHWAFVTGLVVFPAAVVSGYQFPLLIGLLGRGRQDVGKHVGRAYLANTIGAIVGSLAGGFGLLPALLAPGCWRLVAAMLAGLGFASVVLVLVRAGWNRKLIPSAITAMLSVLLLAAPGPTAAWRHSPIGAGRADQVICDRSENAIRNWLHRQRRAIFWEADGIESSVGLDGESGIAFLVNGKSDGSVGQDTPTQVFGGLLGAALHPAPRRSLVIGLGTGSTAGWLAAVPTMERVDVVEIEPAVVRVARECALVNVNMLENRKVKLFTGDAREVVLTSRDQYDIVFSEPSNPYRAGIASLYTQDFYQSVARVLAPGGIFLQWLQLYEVDALAVRTAVSTLVSVFPDVSMWLPGGGDMVLMATREPFVIDVDELRRRAEAEPLRGAMGSVWRTTGAEAFLAHHAANGHLSRMIAERQGNWINTDDQNLLEFAFARTVGVNNFSGDRELWATARRLGLDRPERVKGTVDWHVVEDRRASAMELVPGVAVSAKERREMLRMLTAYRAGDLAGVRRGLAGGLLEPQTLLETEMLAEALADKGDERAVRFIEMLRGWQPVEAEYCSALLRHRQDKPEEAVALLERALVGYRSAPWPRTEMMRRGLRMALELAGRREELARQMAAALQEPFAVRHLNTDRLLTLVEVSLRTGDKRRCVPALEQLEPWVPWDQRLLEDRVACYENNQHRNLARARRDLDDFLSAAPGQLVPNSPVQPTATAPAILPSADVPSLGPPARPTASPPSGGHDDR